MQRNRWKSRSGWWVLVLAMPLIHGCTPELPDGDAECWTLASVPGPEDLVLLRDEKAALVSSQDRRTEPQPEGAIWFVPLDPTEPGRRARHLELRGRQGECSFHPHGVDLETSESGRTLLYVLNHHEPEDLAVERGCFDAPGKAEPRASVTSVEVFEYRDGEIYFLQRLAAPGVLTSGNDLVARRNGDLYVTNPPSSPLARLLDFQGWPSFGLEPSRVIHFDCDDERAPDDRCTGTWREIELGFDEPLRFVNGIEIRESGDERWLYLASSGERRIRVARQSGAGPWRDAGALCLRGMPDNLSWERGEKALFVAAHPLLRRFTQHTRSRGTPSPSTVYRLEPDSGWSCRACVDHPKPERRGGIVFRNAGGQVSAASVAFRYQNDLVVGQVFESGVVRCRPSRRKRDERR